VQLITIDGFEVFVEEADKYVKINDISAKDLPLVWESIRKGFPGYEFDLCFHHTQPPLEALSSIGAELLEDCIEMQVSRDGFIPWPCNDITLLEKTDFAAFAKLHDKVNPDCGGTSQIIQRKWDNWRVFILRKGGEIIGYSIICIAMRDAAVGEIFCVWAHNDSNRKALISAVTNCAFENNKDVIIYMVDRDNAKEYDAAIEAGYKETGYYIGYQVKCIK